MLSQYIDRNGKTRIFNYKDVSVITEPLPPLDIENVVVNDEDEIPIIEGSLQNAESFIKKDKLIITGKDGNENQGIQGLWTDKGYIPLYPIKSPSYLNKIPYVDDNDPIRTDGKNTSVLEKYRINKKIAYYLKEYVLYSYSVAKKDGKKFGTKDFIVIPDHIYDIQKLGQRFYKDKNDIIYTKSGKFIVTNELTMEKLLNYLKLCLLKDEPGVLLLSETLEITNYYQNISDFRNVESSLVFNSKDAVSRWLENLEKKDKLKIETSLSSTETEPYFYKSFKINNNDLVLIQNVQDGDLEKAKTVSMKWIKDKVNIGYNPELSNDDISHYTFTNLGKVSKIKKATKEYANVILYDDQTYGALLFLN